MEIFDLPSPAQLQCVRAVKCSCNEFMKATGARPKEMWASPDFIAEFGAAGFVYLEIQGVKIRCLAGDFDGVYVYASVRQLVD